VETRFAHLFLKLADKMGRPGRDGITIPVVLSRQDLADLTGTTIETCIRIMSRWHKEGTLRTEKKGSSSSTVRRSRSWRRPDDVRSSASGRRPPAHAPRRPGDPAFRALLRGLGAGERLRAPLPRRPASLRQPDGVAGGAPGLHDPDGAERVPRILSVSAQMTKCDMCYHRTSAGKRPMCVTSPRLQRRGDELVATAVEEGGPVDLSRVARPGCGRERA